MELQKTPGSQCKPILVQFELPRFHSATTNIASHIVDKYSTIEEGTLLEATQLQYKQPRCEVRKAVGKSIEDAVFGIQKADGAHQAFKKLSSVASRI
eukprot:scaffold6374_cov121-Cylindrotheca_fusiformis.AAC.3